MAIQVLLTRSFFDNDIKYISSKIKDGGEIIVPESFDEETLIKYAADVNIFFGPVISKKLCEAAPNLLFIQVPWTGIDNLNFELIKEIGVKVCNSHSNAYAVAEHAVAMMLDAAKKLSYHDRNMRLGDWNRPKPNHENLISPFSKRISNSNIGIIGYGHIGQLVKKYLSAFDCKFYVADISISTCKVEEETQFFPMSKVNDVLSTSDFVFLCVPLTNETRRFWGKEKFHAMRNDSILINTSRGEIVDESALYYALTNSEIAGASMDTWYNNPKNPYDVPVFPSKNFSFEKLDNLIMSPHRAAMIQGELPHLDDAILNINRTILGMEPLNVVNVEKQF